MANSRISEMISESMSKIQQMVNVNTVVGTPINADGTTIIPVSKVKIGMGGGGSDFPTSKKADADSLFGSGMGCSVSVDPVAFLVLSNGHVRMLPVAAPASTTVDRVVELAPEMFDKFADFLDGRKSE